MNEKTQGIVKEWLPKYTCNKVVQALKIEDIHKNSIGGVSIIPVGIFKSFTVSPEYVAKHNPVVGGYFVLYEDGYESFSPAEAFENGYTLMDVTEACTEEINSVKQDIEESALNEPIPTNSIVRLLNETLALGDTADLSATQHACAYNKMKAVLDYIVSCDNINRRIRKSAVPDLSETDTQS